MHENMSGERLRAPIQYYGGKRLDAETLQAVREGMYGG